MKEIGSLPTDPMERAIVSAERTGWSFKPPQDVRVMISRAIREHGRDKAFWVYECLREVLGKKYGGKKSSPPSPVISKINNRRDA